MARSIDDLFCAVCAGYAHPFLDACPACGAGRPSRFDDAVAAPVLGFGALVAVPQVLDQAQEVLLRYSLKLLSGTTLDSLREGFAVVADSLPYAVHGIGAVPASSPRAHVELAADDLLVRERNPSREVVRAPLHAILAVRAASAGGRGAGSWDGLAAFGRRETGALGTIDGDLVVTFGGPAGPSRLAISNRRGITVARARADHFVIVARWLAIIGAAAAETRWASIGAARHATELGLAPPGGEETTATPSTTPPGAASVADALSTLEDLRSRSLVTEAEYAEKRREILARL